MRWGKTKVGVDWAGAMHLLENRPDRFPTKVLVITVTDGIEVWHNEIEKHCAVPWMLTTGDHEGPGGLGEQIMTPTMALNQQNVDYTRTNDGIWWRVVNWQNTYAREPTGRGREWIPVPRDDLRRWRPDYVIVDESHHAGKPTTVQSRMAFHFCQRARRVVIMTGTMFHRRPEYVFGQAKLLDPGIFGTEWEHFKRRVCIYGGYGGYEIKRYKNLKWMMRKLKRVVYIEKYVPPGKPVVNIIPAPLDGLNKKVYDKMEAEAIVKLTDGSKATADIILTKHMRLVQIAGGHLRTQDGYRKVGTCKLDIAESRLREYLAQDITKAVIGVRFLPELADLARLALRIGYRPIIFHGRLPRKGRVRPDRVADFQEAKDPVLFIAQMRAAKESIDLSAASTMMLYSLDESYVTYDQFTSRIEKFNDTRRLMYDHIVVPRSRDEVSMEAMKEKQDVATFIADDPERVERIVAANSERRERK